MIRGCGGGEDGRFSCSGCKSITIFLLSQLTELSICQLLTSSFRQHLSQPNNKLTRRRLTSAVLLVRHVIYVLTSFQCNIEDGKSHLDEER